MAEFIVLCHARSDLLLVMGQMFAPQNLAPQRRAQTKPMCATQMVPRGLEPRTLRLLAVRSNQLSYETVGATATANKS